MTSTTPEDSGTTADEGTTEGTTTDATPAPFVDDYTVAVPKGNPGSGRWAVYDKTLERYVGDVRDSKPSATEARKLTTTGSYAIVEV